MSQAVSTETKSPFQAVGGWITKIAGLTSLAVVVVLGAKDLLSDAVTIEPIEVPKALSDIGYTPSVAGHRLRDALNAYAGPVGDERMSRAVLDTVAHEDDSLSANLELDLPENIELPDVMVPQIGLSLRTIMPHIRSALHRSGHAISGELTTRDGKYALRLRINGREVFSQDLEAETPDALMIKAAPEVMNVIRPAAYAIAQYGAQKEKGLQRADEIISRGKSDINSQWAYLLKGSHALRNNNFKEAETMFSLAAGASWNKEQPLLQQGAVLLRQAKIEEAIERFQSVIAINPKSAIAYNNIGVAWMSQAKDDSGNAATVDQAIAQYEKAISADPRYAPAYNNLGLALANRKQVEKAIERYRQAITIAPNYLLAHWNLGFALQSQNRFDEAVGEYQTAIGLTKDQELLAILHTYVGNVHVLQNAAGENDNLAGAIQAYRAAIDVIRPRCYIWAHRNLAAVWTDLYKFDYAITEFRNARHCEQEQFRENQGPDQVLQAKVGGSLKAVNLTSR